MWFSWQKYLFYAVVQLVVNYRSWKISRYTILNVIWRESWGFHGVRKMRSNLNCINVLLSYSGSIVKLTVVHAIEFICILLTSLTVFHMRKRWMLRIHTPPLPKKKGKIVSLLWRDGCVWCAILLLSLTFSRVTYCTNSSFCWYTPVRCSAKSFFF